MFSKIPQSLPEEIILSIFKHLNLFDIYYNASAVNKATRAELLKDKVFWKEQYEIYFPHGLELAEKLEPTTVQTGNTCYWYQAFSKDFKRDWDMLGRNSSAFRLFVKVKQKKPLQEDEIKEMFESELPNAIKFFKKHVRNFYTYEVKNHNDFYAVEDGSGMFYHNNPGFNDKINEIFCKNYRQFCTDYHDVIKTNPNRTFLDWAYINKHQQLLDEFFNKYVTFKEDTSENTVQNFKKTLSNAKLAIDCNQVETLKHLLTDVKLNKNEKSTLLNEIAKLGAVETLKALIEWNIITIDEIQSKYPLYFPLWDQAVKYGNTDLITFLLEKKVPFNQDTLMMAIFYGHSSIADQLITNIKTNANSSISKQSNQKIYQKMFYHAIHAAIALNDKQSVDNLLKAEVFKDLDFHPKKSKTCLGYATWYGNNNNEIIKLLINAGANPNQAGHRVLSTEIEQSDSPIELAILNCDYEALRFLLKQDNCKFTDDIIKSIEPYHVYEPPYFTPWSKKKKPWYAASSFYSRQELKKASEPVKSLVTLMDYTKRIKRESSWNIGIFLQEQGLFQYTKKTLKEEISQTLLDCISGKEDISKLDSIKNDDVKNKALHNGRLGKMYKSLLPSIKEIQKANDDQNTGNNNTQQSLYALD